MGFVRGANSSVVTLRWMRLQQVFSGMEAKVAWRSIDKSEQERAQRLRAQADRESYVAAHALLRLTLSGVSNSIEPSAWRFEIAGNGKPEIHPMLGQSGLRFSLSHTRGMAACCVGYGPDLGVDVEILNPSFGIIDFAKHFFTTPELALILNTESSRQIDVFYRLWTLKEAYLKATGRGIAGGVDKLAFSLDPLSVSFNDGLDDPNAWQFVEFRVSPRHRLAIAIRRPANDRGEIDAAGFDLIAGVRNNASSHDNG
jgi:4'-phosphopantetheinyl transferase